MSPLSVEVRFLGHRTGIDERGASFTLFHISVVADGFAWEVERRFSEFKKLAEQLKQQAAQSGQKDLPALPPALPSAILNPGFMTSSLNKEFVERRAAGLQEYLQALTRHASTDLRQLVDFLSADTDAPAEPWAHSEPGSVRWQGGATPSERGGAREGGATASEDDGRPPALLDPRLTLTQALTLTLTRLALTLTRTLDPTLTRHVAHSRPEDPRAKLARAVAGARVGSAMGGGRRRGGG